MEKILQPTLPVERMGQKTPEVERRDNLNLPLFRFGHKGICLYCGDPADTMDHVIPLAWSDGKRNNKRPPFGPMCPACRDCNCHLSNRYFDSFEARCRWNRDRLEKKAKPILWHTSQIEALDYSLRSFVVHECLVRMWYRFRADWFESRDYLMAAEGLLWQDNLSDYPWLAEYFRSTIRDIKELLSRLQS